MAGKREGLKDQARVFDLCGTWAADPTAPRPDGWHDERSPLAAEPMRWASALRPTLLAWEQVPPVLDLWSHCAQLLGAMGYSTWTGIISAERFGVPQTRKRAILLASLEGTVQPPRPTHQAYVAGEPARHEITLEGELLPWVSMAEALGWDAGERTFDRRQTGGDGTPVPVVPDSAPAPAQTAQGLAKGRDVWRVGFPRNADNGEATPEGYRARDFRDETEPAFTVTDKARSAVKMRANNQPNAAVRSEDEPAPTIAAGHSTGDRVWTEGRPATSVCGDPRIARPGHYGSDDERDPAGRSMTDAVRVSVAEASTLQSFPPDYPWQGSRSAQFTQVGNAVPPLLARAVLAALTEGHDVGSDAIDLFAGPGGWDLGARELGIDPLGIEFDDNACATREAAGLRTLQGDVAAMDPREVADLLNPSPVRW